MLPPQPPATFRPPDRATRQQKRKHEQQILAWLAQRLEDQMRHATGVTLDEYCRRLAREGNPVPLRQLYRGLDLAEFIHAPKLRRGQRYPKAKKRTYAEVAADFAECIRSLWREHTAT